MAVGSYFTTAAPTDALGYLVQSETRVRMGTESLYGSLEVTSWAYTTYEASIGLQDAKAVDFGQVESLSFSHVPTFEPLESVNIQSPSVYVLTGEETTFSVGVQQFDPALIEVALGTGTLYQIGNEFLNPFGGACSALTRPIEIGVTNIACNAPDAPDATAGISAIVLTIYNAQTTSGFDWGDILASETNNFSLEMLALPVLARSLGNRMGNIYIF